jgi:hypothetical protein
MDEIRGYCQQARELREQNMGYATGQTDVLVVGAALTVMTDGAALASKARNLGTGN